MLILTNAQSVDYKRVVVNALDKLSYHNIIGIFVVNLDENPLSFLVTEDSLSKGSVL